MPIITHAWRCRRCQLRSCSTFPSDHSFFFYRCLILTLVSKLWMYIPKETVVVGEAEHSKWERERAFDRGVRIWSPRTVSQLFSLLNETVYRHSWVGVPYIHMCVWVFVCSGFISQCLQTFQIKFLREFAHWSSPISCLSSNYATRWCKLNK